MIKKWMGLLIIGALLLVPAADKLMAHCQVPCGIYDDVMRISLIREHITTIEKAMASIKTLAKQTPLNHNQIIRWTTNKEKHAEELSEIVSYYFLAQRVKPAKPENQQAYRNYQDQLEILHHLIMAAMKTKQSTDTQWTEKLRTLTARFEKLYFAKQSG